MALRFSKRKANAGVSPLRCAPVEMTLLAGLMAMTLVAGANAQDPLTLPGKNYGVELENSDVTVIRAHYGPHEKVPVHDHAGFSTVFVYLSDSGPVKISHEGEGAKEFSVTRPPVVKGAYRIAPGMAERHSIENLGDLSSDFLRVELKQVSLKMHEPFRGKAPATLAADLDAVEFEQPGVKVERIVCAGTSECKVKPVNSPSLLVAFMGTELSSNKTHKSETVEAGAVQWVAAHEGESVKGPAHMLRIILAGSR